MRLFVGEPTCIGMHAVVGKRRTKDPRVHQAQIVVRRHRSFEVILLRHVGPEWFQLTIPRLRSSAHKRQPLEPELELSQA